MIYGPGLAFRLPTKATQKCPQLITVQGSSAQARNTLSHARIRPTVRVFLLLLTISQCSKQQNPAEKRHFEHVRQICFDYMVKAVIYMRIRSQTVIISISYMNCASSKEPDQQGLTCMAAWTASSTVLIRMVRARSRGLQDGGGDDDGDDDEAPTPQLY